MDVLAAKRNNPEAITLWTQRIADCKNSGISAQEWCEQNGMGCWTQSAEELL